MAEFEAYYRMHGVCNRSLCNQSAARRASLCSAELEFGCSVGLPTHACTRIPLAFFLHPEHKSQSHYAVVSFIERLLARRYLAYLPDIIEKQPLAKCQELTMSEPQRNLTADHLEVVDGRERDQIEGWIPDLVSEAELRDALEKAFDYRGDVTITRKDGSRVEGYIFDRRSGPTLADSVVRLMPQDSAQKISVAYSDIAALAFTGRDTAAGKSWEAWVRKYWEKKAAGEKHIALEPEKLD